jgi:hypothetical protein
MKSILAWTSLLVAIASGNALAEPNQYLCTVEHAAGLRYDKQTGAWHPQEFGSRKYVLRRLTDDDRDEKKGKWWGLFKGNTKANWAFFPYGEADPMPIASCVEENPSVALSELFNCQPIAGTAKFDKDTRRFEMIVSGSYIDQGFWEQRRREDPTRKKPVDPSKPDDLFIEIGNCSPS